AQHRLVAAQVEPAPAAFAAGLAMAAEPADADALADAPDRRHAPAQGDDAADHLVAGDAAGRAVLDIAGIRAADAASLDRDQDLAGRRFGDGPLDQLQPARFCDLHGAIGGGHCLALRWLACWRISLAAARSPASMAPAR